MSRRSDLRSHPVRRPDAAPDHLGDLVAGLVDGHLSHAARERALAHLTHCCGCRAEVAALRELRRRLLGLGHDTAAPAGLAERLLAAVPQHPDSAQLVPDPRRSRRGPRAAVIGVVLVAGVGTVLVAGGGIVLRDRPAPRPQVDPSSDPVDVDFTPVASLVATPSPTDRAGQVLVRPSAR